MRALAIGLTLVVALWGVWWWMAASALERAARARIAGLAAQGWQAGAQDFAVAGFPARLDLTVTAPALRQPAGGAAWSAPFVQVLGLAYRPWHVIAAFPPEQQIVLAGAPLTLTADRLRASVVARPAPALPLDRLSVEGDALRLDFPGGALTAEALRAGTRADRADPLRHEVAASLRDLRPAGAPPGGAPPRGAELRVTGAVAFDTVLDRHAALPRPTAIEIAEARLAWGTVAATAQGRLAADAQGRAEGRVAIAIEDWPRALELAVAAGLLRPELAPTFAAMARALSDAAGTPGRVALPLVLAQGRMSLGPLPLGPAPRF